MMRAQYPGLELSFHSLTTAKQIQALLDRSIDVAFLRPPLVHPQLSGEAVVTERLVLPADHPLAAQERIAPSELADARFIHINRQQAGQTLHERIQDWLQRHQLAGQVCQEVHNVLTLLSLAGMGNGLALLPDYAEPLRFRNVVPRRLAADEPEIELLMAWRSADGSSVGQFFRSLVWEWAQANAPAGRRQ